MLRNRPARNASVGAITSESNGFCWMRSTAAICKTDLMLICRMLRGSGGFEELIGRWARASPWALPEGALRLWRQIAAANQGPRCRAYRLSEGGACHLPRSRGGRYR